MNGMTAHLWNAENHRFESEGDTTWESIHHFVVSPGLLKTSGTNNVAGGKDPVEGAEVVVQLALDGKAEFNGGTCWQFEDGMMRQVPW